MLVALYNILTHTRWHIHYELPDYDYLQASSDIIQEHYFIEKGSEKGRVLFFTSGIHTPIDSRLVLTHSYPWGVTADAYLKAKLHKMFQDKHYVLDTLSFIYPYGKRPDRKELRYRLQSHSSSENKQYDLLVVREEDLRTLQYFMLQEKFTVDNKPLTSIEVNEVCILRQRYSLNTLEITELPHIKIESQELSDDYL